VLEAGALTGGDGSAGICGEGQAMIHDTYREAPSPSHGNESGVERTGGGYQ